jgi:DNA (cytosine-5)-methyltransferase 1
MSKKTLQRNLNIDPEKSKLEDFNNVEIKSLKAFKIKKDKQKILRPYKLNKQNKLKKNDLKESDFSLNEPSLFYKNIESNKKYEFKFIDLFAGIGGFHFAMEELGGKCVFASEIDQYARKTYEANFYDKNPELFESENFNDDITKQDPKDIPDFDILCGGFPCQPFSIAGYRKGFEDKGRGDLIFNIVEIIKVKQPRVVFLENVKNLYSHDKGQTYKYIKELIEKQGYFVTEKVLNTMEYGNLPQNRERLYILGFKNQADFDKFEFPKPQKLDKKLADILEKKPIDQYYYYNDKPLFEKIKNDVIKENTVYQWRRVYTRENKSGVCPTLTANMGTGGHNVPIIKDKKGIRKLVPTECARLQGFPSDFIFPNTVNRSNRYKQVGNAVSVPLVKSLADKIKIIFD